MIGIHRDIMDLPDYFDICQELTSEYQKTGQSFCQYSRGNITGDVCWDDSAFASINKAPFFVNRDGVNEYLPEQLAMTGELECCRFKTDSRPYQYLQRTLGLRYMVADVNVQQPGHVVGVHADHFRSLSKLVDNMRSEDIRRYVIFLEDQQIGQSFMVGLESMSWHANDIVEFPWYALHATANASLVPKRLITVSGVK